MATARAFHAGGLLLLPLRRSPRGPSPSPWSHFRTHLISSKPPPSTPLPPPVPTARPSSVGSAFGPPSRKTGVVGAGSGAGVVGWYLGLLDARPVLTKSVTAAAIFTAADLSSQMLTLGPEDSLDFLRTMRMASYGFLISGPSLHLWFNFISKLFPKKDVVNTLKKMFIGQAVYGPIINSVFFSYNAGLQDKFNKPNPLLSLIRALISAGKLQSVCETVPEIIARLKRDLVPTIKSGLLYWPTCDFITFKFVPVHLQPLVSNSFSFLWTIYITYMASLKKADVEVAPSS